MQEALDFLVPRVAAVVDRSPFNWRGRQPPCRTDPLGAPTNQGTCSTWREASQGESH